ncbi:MAG: clan AA aspartic protease [Saprospiraceae bacterium]|nr:clan AA aspartic protease [Saprospiraceae bacterium]
MKNLIIILLFYCYPVSGQLINKLEKLYQEKQFVELEIQNRRDNNILYFYYKAIFANVCNKPKLSNEFLDSMEVKALPKSILYKYWVLRNDNYVKCFDYKNAYLSNKLINSQFKKNLNKEEFEGSLQSEQIWYSLQTVPPQQILKEKKVSILLKYDIAGLMNLSVSTKSGESDFVFDTGAGLSTISEVEAKRLGFRILESSKILVKGFTGIDNEIKIGIIDTLTIGRIKILNPVF